MKQLICTTPLQDTTIIENLKTTGITRRNAEDELFHRYAYIVRQGMTKYGLPEEDALDAYADTILVVIRSVLIGAFEARASLKTYCYQIFSNKCVDAVRKLAARKNSVHRTVELDAMQSYFISLGMIVEEHADCSRLEAVKQKLSLLSDSSRQMLLLFAEGYSDKEIARLLSFKNADVVKTSRLRSLKKLRQLLDERSAINN